MNVLLQHHLGDIRQGRIVLNVKRGGLHDLLDRTIGDAKGHAMAEHRRVQDVGPRDDALELTGVVDDTQSRDALLREHRVGGNQAFADVESSRPG